MENKGLVIRDWASQVLILEHKAVGAFLCHCGWNSILEGVSAGIPMITWPMFADPFNNEKLVTQILLVGVPVGAEKWDSFVHESLKSEASVKREAIERVVTRIMVGDDAEEMINMLGEMANRAIEEGSSSLPDLTILIEELWTLGGS